MRALPLGKRSLLPAVRHAAGPLRLIVRFAGCPAGDQFPSLRLVDFGASAPEDPPLPRDSEAEEPALDPSLPAAPPESFDGPSFDGVFEGVLRVDESEVAELRESVL